MRNGPWRLRCAVDDAVAALVAAGGGDGTRRFEHARQPVARPRVAHPDPPGRSGHRVAECGEVPAGADHRRPGAGPGAVVERLLQPSPSRGRSGRRPRASPTDRTNRPTAHGPASTAPARPRKLGEGRPGGRWRRGGNRLIGLFGFQVLKTASARSRRAHARATATSTALRSASPILTSNDTIVPMTG